MLVIGGANLDHLIRGPRVPTLGETAIGSELSVGPGGKGANAAVGASRLGARTAFVGRVGVDAAGRAILDRLRDERVETSHVVADTHASTGVALIMVDQKGRKAIMTAPGANARLQPADVEAARELFDRAAVVVVQLEPELPAVEAAIRVARAAGARIVVDAAPARERLPAHVIAVDVLRANAGEATTLTGIDVEDEDSGREASRWLRKRGAAATCISVDRGDLVCADDVELMIPHLDVAAIDTTGSGDAFVAGLAVGLAEHRSLVDAAWLGAASAAAKATRLGAQALPSRAEVEKLLASAHK